MAKHLRSPCEFYFTIFAVSPGHDVNTTFKNDKGVTSHPHKDLYHFMTEDVFYAAKGLPWSIRFIGDWNHPRGQSMVRASFVP